MLDQTLTLDQQQATILTGLVIPFVVGLITKRITARAVKAGLLLALSVIGGTITQIVENGGSFVLKDTLVGIGVAYFVGQASYTNVYKPSGLAAAVAGATDKVGLTIKEEPDKVAEPIVLGGGTIKDGTITVDKITAGTVTADDVVVVNEPDDEPEPDPEPVEDEVPYDEDPDPDVAVINPDDLDGGPDTTSEVDSVNG